MSDAERVMLRLLELLMFMCMGFSAREKNVCFTIVFATLALMCVIRQI